VVSSLLFLSDFGFRISDFPLRYFFMKRMVVVGIVVLVVVVLIGFAVSSKKGTVSTSVTQPRRSGSSDDILPAAREMLQKETGYPSCRQALQQLNTYIHRNPAKKPEPVSDTEVFRRQFGLTDGEFAEVNSSTFTLLDAHYVDSCMLLRDAAYSLGVEGQPPLERAQAAFGWVVRQVQLREPTRPLPLVPTQFVLRRGWGSSLERSLAFLAMLQQMGVPGCVIGYQEEGANPRLLPLIGALVDKEIFLFDPRLGMPLPAPDGKGIATLRQVRASDRPFAALTMDATHSYDIAAEQVRHAEILLTVPLSALGTRMKLLDGILGGRQKLRSFVDGPALLKEFRLATEGQSLPIRFWGETGDRAAPMRTLRNFMPSPEGGIDDGRLMLQMRLQLVPGFSIPPVIQADMGEFGSRLASVFWAPFGDFFMDSHGPREQVLRGQLDDAIKRLTQAPVVLRFREALFSMLAPLTDQEAQWVRKGTHQLSLDGLEQLEAPEPSPLKVRRWCDRALVAYANLPNGGEAARDAASNVFREGEDDLNNLFLSTVKKPLVAEANYQIALCFHEKAVRLQNSSRSQVAWQAAASKWHKYLEVREDFAKSAISQAHLLRAEALRMQGDVPAAIAELKEPVAGLSSLEETARLYRIRQLEKRASSD